jgi:hypothetical protein
VVVVQELGQGGDLSGSVAVRVRARMSRMSREARIRASCSQRAKAV